MIFDQARGNLGFPAFCWPAAPYAVTPKAARFHRTRGVARQAGENSQSCTTGAWVQAITSHTGMLFIDPIPKSLNCGEAPAFLSPSMTLILG